MIAYQTSWMTCMAQQTGHALDYMGLWNERPQPSAEYLLGLRAAMDAAGFAGTQIIVMDGGFDASEVALAQANASYAAAVHGAGLHYPCDQPHPEVREVGWTFWSSEDYSRDPAWSNGATYWGKALSQNYVLMNMTSTISWSLIWSAYTNLVCNGAGLMRAHEPWSGNYEVSAPVWLTAHWTQFVQPGWRFLSVAGGGSGFLDVAGMPLHSGTYVALVPSDSLAGLTVIIETLNNVGGCLERNMSFVDLGFTTRGGLPGPGTVLHVWATTETAYFVQLPDITVSADSTFALRVPPDAMVTVSTVGTASKGGFPTPVPASGPFPVPYADDFGAQYPYDAMAKYFSDQGGSWAVRSGTLQQVSGGDPGGNAWAPNPDPLTLFGDVTWADYAVSATAVFEPAGPTAAAGAVSVAAAGATLDPRRAPGLRRRGSERLQQWQRGAGLEGGRPSAARPRDVPTVMAPCDATDAAQRWAWNTPAPGYLSNVVGYNTLCLNVGGCDPADIIFYACVDDASGSSCGAPPGSYPNLVWSLNASTGFLTTPMDGHAAPLTLDPATGTLSLAPPAPGSPTQRWAYTIATQALSVGGLCLSTPPARSYVQVCGRIESYDGFDATTTPGYCVSLDARGRWALAVNSVPVVQGNVSAPFAPSAPHALALNMAGTVIEAYVGGARVASITDATYAYGNAAVGSGWHAASFDNFTVTAPF